MFLSNKVIGMATIARPVDAIADDILRHRPEVVGEARPRKEIDNQSSEINGIVAQLSRLVVPWKDVVVVVPSFTQGCQCNRQVLSGIDVPII